MLVATVTVVMVTVGWEVEMWYLAVSHQSNKFSRNQKWGGGDGSEY